MEKKRDGLTIARELIAREAEEQTGSLDLGWLGLTELPSEVFALTHLRELDLGYSKENKERYDIEQNEIRSVDALKDLAEL